MSVTSQLTLLLCCGVLFYNVAPQSPTFKGRAVPAHVFENRFEALMEKSKAAVQIRALSVASKRAVGKQRYAHALCLAANVALTCA
jgi:hypothetical protein